MQCRDDTGHWTQKEKNQIQNLKQYGNAHWLQKKRNQNQDQHQHGITAIPTSVAAEAQLKISAIFL